MILCLLLFSFRFLHLHTQGKIESRGTGGNTGVSGYIDMKPLSSIDRQKNHPLSKIESQGSKIGFHSGSEESHGETKTKEATFGMFRKR